MLLTQAETSRAYCLVVRLRPALLLNAMSVAPEHEHEFNDWYNSEHIPVLDTVPGTLRARRYRGTGSAVQRYLAVYYLTSTRYLTRFEGELIEPGVGVAPKDAHEYLV